MDALTEHPKLYRQQLQLHAVYQHPSLPGPARCTLQTMCMYAHMEFMCFGMYAHMS